MTIMKNFFVLLSFCILIEFFALAAESGNKQTQIWIDDCLDQLMNHTSPAEQAIDPGLRGCFIACMVKKIGKNDEVLPGILKRAIEEIKDVNNKLYTQLIDKLDNCLKQVRGDDCELMDCIDLFSVPFSTLLQQPIRLH